VKQNKLSFSTRIMALTQMGFACMVVFCLVGNCTGHREASATCLLLVVVMWAAIRIVLEGILASAILVGPNSDKQQQSSKKDDDLPPQPPTAVA
jgi:hypothetical protein